MSAKKTATIFLCDNCGNEFPLWSGKCPACGEWNTLKELKLASTSAKKSSSAKNLILEPVAKKLKSQSKGMASRFQTGIKGLDNSLGGGFVPGEVVLLAGEPGIGKSTILLSVCLNFTAQGNSVIYFSGEESENQILSRLDRVAGRSAKDLDKFYVQYETSTENIINAIEKYSPTFVVVDSIQAVSSESIDSSPGNLSQVKQSAILLAEIAKRKGIIVVLVGQVTKEGTIAGPKVIEHLVDCVLRFEGERLSDLRVLRSTKNRFGSTDEVSFFSIADQGMVEITDPSKFFISESKSVSGVARSVILQGNRPVMIEVQALMNRSAFGYPKRLSEGYSRNRLELLAAIIQKRLGINLSEQDLYVKILGGLNVKDPVIDLAVVAAIVSVYKDKPLALDQVFLGEVSLSGQILNVTRLEFRTREAKKSRVFKIIASKAEKASKAKIVVATDLSSLMKLIS